MVNTPEQFIQAQKLTFDLFQAVALKSVSYTHLTLPTSDLV